MIKEDSEVAQSMSEIMNPSASKADADFPNAPEGWTRQTAEGAAKSDGIDLDADHWETIKALQAYFARENRPQPNIRELHDGLGERFHAKGGLKYLYEIFPGGPVAQGCRFAGLEPPAGAVDKSFGSVV
jgi:TusE/DsrC/DsvC family sulfur relay protein